MNANNQRNKMNSKSEKPKGWHYPDSRMPTEQERQKLCRMLHFSLLEIRMLGYEGKAKQAHNLADAFHNLPELLWSDVFSFNVFRSFLQGYKELHEENCRFNYLAMLDAITKEEN